MESADGVGITVGVARWRTASVLTSDRVAESASAYRIDAGMIGIGSCVPLFQ